MENKEWSPDELRHKAESCCVTAERCEQDIRLKLKQWNCDDSLARQIIAHLYNSGFMDTARYCHAFVHDKIAYQGWGRVKIAYMLRAKNLPTADIQNALSEIDEDEYMNRLRHLAEQFIRLNRKKYAANPASLFRFLTQRGFTADEIRQQQLNTTE